MQNDDSQTASEGSPPSQEVPPSGKKSHKRLWLLLGAGLVVVIVAVLISWWLWPKPAAKVAMTSSAQKPTVAATTAQGLQLNTAKNYGNKYKDGILPVGDGKYVTSTPKVGYVYVCSQYAQNLATDKGGAMTRGPWFSSDGQTYDINKKLHVEGSVTWNGSYSDTVSGDTRTIISNDLPITDPTGIFPISASDPAYQYDHNPNSIEAQTFTYDLAANPDYSETPNCIGGQVGVMNTGVALFSAFDAGGRDAGAWEEQDDCDGHPQEQGVYHYHTLSSCIKNVSVHNVIGYALDGFPITGPQVNGPNDVLTTSDLDECHGIVSSYTLDGKTVTGYHYVMTEDFPYSVSCYRGKPITPPGLSAQQQAQHQGQIPNRQGSPTAR